MVKQENIIAQLTVSDLQFLHRHFNVYDPISESTSKNFLGLERYRVIFVGELHSTKILQDQQKGLIEILQRLWGNKPHCFLQEGLAPGQTFLDKGRVTRGADVREPAVDEALYHQFIALSQKFIEVCNARSSYIKTNVKEIAAVLNQNTNDRTLLQRFDVDFGEYNHARTSAAEELNTTISQMATDESYRISLSNRGLASEVIAASCIYKRMIAIWGAGHFQAGEDIYEGLDRAQIHYIVLLPTRENIQAAILEKRWQTGQTKWLNLTISCQSKDYLIKIPKELASEFSPSLQQRMQPQQKKKERCLVNRDTLIGSISFQAETIIQFEGINSEDYSVFADFTNLTQKNPLVLELETRPQIQRVLCSAIQTMILLKGLSLKSISFSPDIQFRLSFKTTQRVLEVISPEPFCLEIEKGDLFTTTTSFLRELRRQREFWLKSPQRLAFTDIASAEALIDALNQKAPYGMLLNLSGNYQISVGTFQLLDKTLDVVWLETPNEVKLHLTSTDA